MRLKPFISRRAMIKDTYVEYLRYKFKYEDYPLKRALVMGYKSSYNNNNNLKITVNTLAFFVRAYCQIGKTEDTNGLMARRIIKNLLSVQFSIFDNNKTSTLFNDLKMEFKHLQQTRKSKDKVNYCKWEDLKQFDKCLVYLNKSLGIQL